MEGKKQLFAGLGLTQLLPLRSFSPDVGEHLQMTLDSRSLFGFISSLFKSASLPGCFLPGTLEQLTLIQYQHLQSAFTHNRRRTNHLPQARNWARHLTSVAISNLQNSLLGFTILILHIKKMTYTSPSGILPHNFCISYTEMHDSIILVSIS